MQLKLIISPLSYDSAASVGCVSVQGEMNKLIIVDAPPYKYTLYVHGVRNDKVLLPVCRRVTVCACLCTRSPTTIPVAYTCTKNASYLNSQ